MAADTYTVCQGVPAVAQQKRIWLVLMRMQVQSLAPSVGQAFGVAVSCDVGRQPGSDPGLLWLWCRPMAIAPVGPPAWEVTYAMGAALERQKKKKKSSI